MIIVTIQVKGILIMKTYQIEINIKIKVFIQVGPQVVPNTLMKDNQGIKVLVAMQARKLIIKELHQECIIKKKLRSVLKLLGQNLVQKTKGVDHHLTINLK